MSSADTKRLRERVEQFSALELPGQPKMMHMGTAYLVNDLWRELATTESIIAAQYRALCGMAARLGLPPPPPLPERITPTPPQERTN